MLTTFILPLISIALGLASPITGGSEEPMTSSATPRSAQVRLAETLANADAIHSIRAHGHAITFSFDRDGKAYRVDATTHGKGEVASLAVFEVGPAQGDVGSLSWLADELAQATAVTTLTVDEDGAVTIGTDDGRTYMAIPGRGSGGNVAVEARWAAAWNSSDS